MFTHILTRNSIPFNPSDENLKEMVVIDIINFYLTELTGTGWYVNKPVGAVEFVEPLMRKEKDIGDVILRNLSVNDSVITTLLDSWREYTAGYLTVSKDVGELYNISFTPDFAGTDFLNPLIEMVDKAIENDQFVPYAILRFIGRL